MTKKRSSSKPATQRTAGTDAGSAGNEASTGAREAGPASSADAPITGVASGSLGTAANLDDTQVMRTADLQRAAAQIAVPAWLTDDAPPLPDESASWAGGTVVEPVPDPRDVPVPERVQPRERVQSRARAKAGPQLPGSVNASRRTSALAGAAAGAVLVLLAGAALLGNPGSLGTNSGVGQGPPLAESSFEPFATPSPEPTQDAKSCHGKGKGNGCKD